VRVVLQEGETLDQLLARFRRGVQKNRILSEYKRHTEFISPSERRRMKILKAIRKNRKRMARQAARQRDTKAG
jgi:ribosomal protein S21